MSPFHRLVFLWEDGTRLEIEWVGGREGTAVDLPPVRNVVEATSETQPDVLGERGVPALCWRDESTLFEPLQLRENAEYLIDITLPISPTEAEEMWKADNAWPLTTVRNAYKSEPQKRWKREAGATTVTGRLNFRSYVGAAELRLPRGWMVAVEVACAKMGYFDDLRALLEAIADEYASLLLEVESPTFSRFALETESEPQLLTFLFLLRHAMDDDRLPAAIDHILGSFRTRVQTHERYSPIGRTSQPVEGDVARRFRFEDFMRGGPLAGMFGGYTPREILESHKHETFDTPENRYVKSFLEDLLEKAETLRDHLQRQRHTVTANQVDRWCLQISDWLRHAQWAEVRRMTHFPSNSQILQKSAGYRDVLATDAQLHLGMTLPWNAGFDDVSDVHGDLRPISRLYEYWCFFLLRSVLRDVCGPEIRDRSNLIRLGDNGLTVVLRKGQQSSLVFSYRSSSGQEAVVTLFYNKKFEKQSGGDWAGSYSVVFNPDFSISVLVRHSDVAILHWLHFDAKYRLDFTDWESEIEPDAAAEDDDAVTEEDEELREIYKKSDLFKMHTYRDALLGSRGSYIIYPGVNEDEDVFIRYPGIEYPNDGPNIPSVGAFQARPAQQTAQSASIRAFIRECLERLTASTPYQEETALF